VIALRARTWNRLAVAVSAAMILGAAGLTARLCAVRVAWMVPEVDPAPGRIAAAQRPAPTLAELAVIWQRDLRQPVVDRPPEAQREPKPECKLELQLIGTAVEREQRYGVFQLADGRAVVRSLGGDVGGYTIVEITRGRARVRSGAREYELRVPWYDRIAGNTRP